ncbi:MAG: TRAP transporter large permease subunit, partial [Deltaproteobacteria bacterium]|nr:TRAP transporter large permease subunit [Deltaproteobacteria bacterium]
MIDLSPEVLAVLMFVGLIIGLLLGHPLAFVLGGLAVIFGFIGWGPGCFGIFMNRIYGIMDNYILIAIPLFIFMAQILDRSGVSEGLFDAMRHLFGPIRGGIAIAVVVVSTL